MILHKASNLRFEKFKLIFDRLHFSSLPFFSQNWVDLGFNFFSFSVWRFKNKSMKSWHLKPVMWNCKSWIVFQNIKKVPKWVKMLNLIFTTKIAWKSSYLVIWVGYMLDRKNDCENTLSPCKMISHDPPPAFKDFTQGYDIKVLRSYCIDDRT